MILVLGTRSRCSVSKIQMEGSKSYSRSVRAVICPRKETWLPVISVDRVFHYAKGAVALNNDLRLKRSFLGDRIARSRNFWFAICRRTAIVINGRMHDPRCHPLLRPP